MPEDNYASGKSDRNCMLCEDHDSVDDMVQCDNCDLWAHYCCANVTETVKESPWVCSKCTNSLQVPKYPKKPTTRKTSGKKSNKSDTGSESGKVDAIVASFEESLAQLQLEKNDRVKQLDEERILHEKRLEMEREIMDKKRVQKKQMLERQLAQEQQLLEQQLRDEQEFLQRRLELRNRFQKLKLDLSQQFDQPSESDDEEETDAGTEKAKDWLESVNNDPRGAYPKNKGVPEIVVRSSANQPVGGYTRNVDFEFPRPTKLNEPGLKKDTTVVHHSQQNSQHQQQASANVPREVLELLQRPDLTAHEETVLRNILNRRRPEAPDQVHDVGRGPTQEQLAARQAVSKHLPMFRGEPEVWPLFISCYEYTTAACGFTNTDNLKRLQDSLQGLAREAVQSRLLMPDSVPEVIEDLRKLFGNPEKLLKTLVA